MAATPIRNALAASTVAKAVQLEDQTNATAPCDGCWSLGTQIGHLCSNVLDHGNCTPERAVSPSSSSSSSPPPSDGQHTAAAGVEVVCCCGQPQQCGQVDRWTKWTSPTREGIVPGRERYGGSTATVDMIHPIGMPASLW